MKKVTIAIIDGQGGGIGSYIIKEMREHFSDGIEIIALGTNAMATAAMMRAKANKGASGENAIVQTLKWVDVIVGPWTIALPHAMMGELTPTMAEAVASSRVPRLLLPLKCPGFQLIGVEPEPLPHQTFKLIQALEELLRKEQGDSDKAEG